jgi:hypothetical protein
LFATKAEAVAYRNAARRDDPAEEIEELRSSAIGTYGYSR